MSYYSICIGKEVCHTIVYVLVKRYVILVSSVSCTPQLLLEECEQLLLEECEHKQGRLSTAPLIRGIILGSRRIEMHVMYTSQI